MSEEKCLCLSVVGKWEQAGVEVARVNAGESTIGEFVYRCVTCGERWYGGVYLTQARARTNLDPTTTTEDADVIREILHIYGGTHSLAALRRLEVERSHLIAGARMLVDRMNKFGDNATPTEVAWLMEENEHERRGQRG